MYRRGQLVLVLSHEDDQWHDGVFLDYVGSKCRVLWEEVEPGQSPTALVDGDVPPFVELRGASVAG